MSDSAFARLSPAPSAAPPPQYVLRDRVARVRRDRMVVLVSPVDGRSVRISKVGEELIPLLAGGASLDEMARHLNRRFPGAGDVRFKLRRFLEQLADAGLLADRDAAKRRRPLRRIDLLQLDGAARRVAAVLRTLPRDLGWGLVWALALFSAMGIAALVLSGKLPHPRELATGFSWAGMLFLLLVILPLHEFAHAVAARLAGIRVGAAGLAVHGFVPGPYVDTGNIYQLADRRSRFWIPAAGPLVDLAACGTAAWMIVTGSDALGSTAAGAMPFLFLASLIMLLMNLNPLMPSDGSNMLSALLNDELARRSAISLRASPLSRPMDVAIYRIVTSLFWQGLAVLLWFWWFHAP